MLGPELADRARIDRSWSTAIGAGRWDEEAAFAVIATLGIFEGRRTLLVGLRHGFPYDALEVVAATSVAALLALAHSDNRAVAEEQRRADSAEARLALTDRIQSALLALRDRGALLQETVRDLADRVGARGTSVLLVEGSELRMGAAVGLASEALRQPRRIGEGIAGWVAQRGERLVLRGRVTEERFRGTDPHAAESVIVPLRAGGNVLGVLNVKRGPGEEAFAPAELSLIDGVADDLALALRAMDGLAALERDRDSAIALAEIGRLVAAGDGETALRVAVGALGHHAAAVLRADGVVIGEH
ncbi:MAG: GAF domain-containing protein, partial [Candidatus Limnocylindria bacterium]